MSLRLKNLSSSPKRSHPPLDPTPEPIQSGAVVEVTLQAKLQSLANTAQNLNELSDRLTQKVSQIESEINKLNLGVRATVDMETRQVDEYVQRVRLGYRKTASGKWGLIVLQYLDEDPESTYEEWAFKDAPRDLRLKVVERIPHLLDELVTTSTKLASEISDKIGLAGELILTLQQSLPSGSK